MLRLKIVPVTLKREIVIPMIGHMIPEIDHATPVIDHAMPKKYHTTPEIDHETVVTPKIDH